MTSDQPTVVTAATDRNLVTLELVRLECDIVDHSEDRQLAMWLRQASGVIEQRCDPCLVRETFRQNFENVYTKNGIVSPITLSRYPNVTITSVVEDDETLVDDTDYEVIPDTGFLYRRSGGSRICWNAARVVVVYGAGYTPGDDLLVDFERATVLLTKQYRFASGRDPMVSSSEVASAGSTRYFGGVENPTGLSPEVEGLISKYTFRTNW